MERIKDGNAERQRVRYYRKKLKGIGVDAYSEGMPSSSEALKSMFDELKDKKPHVRLTLAHGPEVELEEELEEDKDNSSSSKAKATIQDVSLFYQNNFGVMSPYLQDDLTHWVNDLSPELVIESMKRAIDGQKNYNYAKGIMKRWLTANIKTMEQVESSEMQFERNKQQQQQSFSKPKYNKQKYEKQIPDWMDNQQQAPKQQEQPIAPEPDIDLEANEKAIRDKMANLFGGDGNQTNN